MYLNLHLEKKLADQRMYEDQCAAKLDCLLRGIGLGTEKNDSDFIAGLARFPLMVILMPFQIGTQILKRT